MADCLPGRVRRPSQEEGGGAILGAPGVTKAVIPAAGRGSRLAALGLGIRKEMLPVGGVPLLSRAVWEALEAGVRELVVVVSPDGEPTVRSWLGALAWGLESPERLRYAVVVQEEPRGLGDALLRCRRDVGTGPFAVLLPDNIFWGEFSPLRALMDASDAEAHLVGLIEVEERDAPLFSDSGLCEAVPVGRNLYRVERLYGKGHGTLTISGRRLKTCGRQIYLPDMWPLLASTKPGPGQEHDDVQLLQILAQEGRLLGVRLEGRLFDVGHPAGYAEACRYACEEAPWWR